MLELLRCSTRLDTSLRLWRGRGVVVVTVDATWDSRVCEQSVKCIQGEMHTRSQVHSSTAYRLGPGGALVEIPTSLQRAPTPGLQLQTVQPGTSVWCWGSFSPLTLSPPPHFSSPSPSPALPTYPHVSLSPPDSGKRLYLVAARTGLWVALPLAESGLTLSRRRIRREESNEVFFEKPGRRLSMIPGPAGRGWREGLAGVRKRRQAGSG
jgi:hypothetical protein